MVQSIYKYFDSDLSESHRAELNICTLLDPWFKNYNMWPTRVPLDICIPTEGFLGICIPRAYSVSAYRARRRALASLS